MPIRKAEMEGVIRALKKNKACGDDRIPNECMIHVWEEWKGKILDFYSECLSRGIFPKAWKEARVRWLPKKSGGFRPISLLPTLGKLLDRVVNARLMNWYEREGKMSERQLGFRRARSTVDALVRVNGVLDGYRERG